MPRRLTDAEARALVAGWYNPDPNVPFPGVDKPWPGTCNAGHLTAPRLSAMRAGQGPCLDCAGKRKYTDAEARELVASYFTPDADAPYPGASKPWPGTCPAGHRTKPTLRDTLAKKYAACFTCAGQPRRTDAEARTLAAQWYNPHPDVPFPGVSQPWPGVCRQGHPVRPTLANLQRGHGPCLTCAGRARMSDAEARERAAQWFTPDPDVPYPGMSKPWPGTCHAGHRVAPRMHALINLWQGPCRTCAGKAKRTDASARAEVAHVYTPDADIPYPGALVPWPGVCPQGHRIAPRLNTIANGGGCQQCAVRGFNPARPGWLYLRQDLERGMQKVGITNRDDDGELMSRSVELRAHGGVAELVDRRYFADGMEALEQEQRILDALDDAGVPRGEQAWGQDRFDGYTETWPIAAAGRAATSLDDLVALLTSTSGGPATWERPAASGYVRRGPFSTAPRREKWQANLAALRQFAEREGHTRVPRGHVENGVALAAWVGRVRGSHRRDNLSAAARADMDSVPGWEWDPPLDEWSRGMDELRHFVAREGHAVVPRQHRERAFALGSWVADCRWQHKRGELPAERVAEVETVPGWSWAPREDRFALGLAAFDAFVQREGNGLVPSRHVENGFPLGKWVRTYRQMETSGMLSPERRAVLDGRAGWVWRLRRAPRAAGELAQR